MNDSVYNNDHQVACDSTTYFKSILENCDGDFDENNQKPCCSKSLDPPSFFHSFLEHCADFNDDQDDYIEVQKAVVMDCNSIKSRKWSDSTEDEYYIVLQKLLEDCNLEQSNSPYSNGSVRNDDKDDIEKQIGMKKVTNCNSKKPISLDTIRGLRGFNSTTDFLSKAKDKTIKMQQALTKEDNICKMCKNGNYRDYYPILTHFLTVGLFPCGALCSLKLKRRKCNFCGFINH